MQTNKKYKAGLGSQVEAEHAYEEKQKQLKEKHEIKDKNVVVVEQKSLSKFLIKTGIAGIKVLSTICILTLAAFGLIALIYPDPRSSLFDIIINVISDVKIFTGLGGN